MNTTTNSRLKDIIAKAEARLNKLSLLIDDCKEDIAELNKSGDALITIAKGDKVAIRSMSLKVLGFYYLTKKSMLAITSENDYFNDVEDCVNFTILDAEVKAIILFMRDNKRMVKALTKLENAKTAFFHLSNKLSLLDSTLAIKEAGADMLDKEV